jgi:cell division septum initiation protein DivIVA
VIPDTVEAGTLSATVSRHHRGSTRGAPPRHRSGHCIEDGTVSDRENSERPSFEVALRGYDKSEVDRYTARVERDMAKLVADRDRAKAEIDGLKTLVQQLRTEATELQGRPIQIDREKLSDLGPMVEQMLTLAEKQAKTIVAHANQRAASREAEADKLVGLERAGDWTRDQNATDSAAQDGRHGSRRAHSRGRGRARQDPSRGRER